LEADLPHYLGRDAKMVDSHVCPSTGRTMSRQLTLYRSLIDTSSKLFRSRCG
jgi:hypothetical protein